MSIETAVLIGKDGQPLYWHLRPDRSAGFIPDPVSTYANPRTYRNLWDAIADNIHDVTGVAHSHPGAGNPAASGTDVTTFSAIERGLGKRLDWWIATEDRVALFRQEGPGIFDYAGVVIINEQHLPWLKQLRQHSYGP